MEPMSFNLRSAWGGIVGPAAFISAWLVGGAEHGGGYSPVDDAISRLAAIGASTRPLMTAGFVGFGVAVPVYAMALKAAVPGPAWKTAVATGLATLGVAAFPLDKSSTIDQVHAAMAALGYLTLAATPLLAARPLAAAGHRRAASLSVVVGVGSGLCLVGTLVGPAHGLLQRIGLTMGDAWLISSAAWILAGRRAGRAPAAGGRGAAPQVP
jgi:hypothetical membrane protein